MEDIINRRPVRMFPASFGDPSGKIGIYHNIHVKNKKAASIKILVMSHDLLNFTICPL